MADAADIAFELADARIARSLAMIAADIPDGAPGTCDECEEFMPRLVDGRCGFCRDGRRPPLSFYADRAAPVPAPASTTKEHVPMPKNEPVGLGRKITIDGAALKAVEERAVADLTSWKQAADALILEAVARGSAPADRAPNAPMSGGVLSVATVDELLAELQARFDIASSNEVAEDALRAAVERADAAEARLARVQTAIGGDV